MKTLKSFTFSIVIILLLLAPIAAQDTGILQLIENPDELITEDREAEVESSRSLEIDFVQNMQDPVSKIARFEMIIRSNVTSDRVRVIWDAYGSVVPADETQEVVNLFVQAGQSYRVPIDVLPFRQGVSEVYGEARLVGADDSEIATVRKNFATNASLDILPISDDYRNAQILSFVWWVIQLILLVLVALILSFFGFKAFVRWYKADEGGNYTSKV